MKSWDFRFLVCFMSFSVFCLRIVELDKSSFTNNYYGLRDLDDEEIPQGAATLAFVFDVTGSMYDDLVQVIDGAKKILSTILARREKIIYDYVLVPFHDPDIGPVTHTTDPDLFQRQLKELYVQGGGDCPEMSIGAIKKALEECLPNSHIYVFTDARSKDYRLLDDVLKLIQRKQSQVVFVMTGDCGDRSHPGFQAYERIASTSSGQIFHLRKADVNEVLNFVRLSLQARKVNLFAVDRNAGNAQEIPFDVDGSLKEFTISVSGDNPQVIVIDADGEVFDKSKGLTELLRHRNISIVNIKDPSPGRWKVKASTAGPHTIRATGLSNVDFVHGFSRQPTANMRETYHRPLKGVPTYLLVNGTELPEPATFQHVNLVDLEGKSLQNIPLYRLPDSNLFNATTFFPPDDYFYLQVAGVDESGYPIERITSTAISAQLPDVPEVNTRPRMSAYYDEDTDLRCYVQSLVPFTVVWYKDGVKISQEQNFPQTSEMVLTVPEVTIISEGWYSCNATNIAGSSSSAVYLDVKEPPPVIQKSGNVSGIIDGQVILPCEADSIVSHNITWSRLTEDDLKKGFFKSVPVMSTAHSTIYPNGSLVIYNLRKNDEGWYRCTATNEGGSVQEHIYLNAYYLPIVKVSPQSLNFVSGQSVYVACSAAGYPPPRIKWKWADSHNEAFFSGRSKIVGNNLAIESAEPNDEGRYDCIATNEAGSVTANVHLNYIEAPVITLPDKDLLIKNGEQAELRCIAEGIPDPTISWFKGNIEVHPLSYIQILGDGSLVIYGIQEVDAGSYTCVATNEAGKTNDTVTLSVGSKPTVVPLPKNVSVGINENGSIPCIASGIPQPHVSWYRDDGKDVNSNSRFSVSPLGQLRLQRVNLTDQGKYICIAENKFGIEKQEIELFVTGIKKPVLVKFPPTTDIHKGQEKFLNCILQDGNPKPEIQWLQNTKVIEPSNDISVQNNGTLRIAKAQESHEGYYTCIASNVGGNASETTFLNVLVSPSIHTDIHEIKVLQGSPVTLPCEVDGDPKPEITWYKDGYAISSSNFMLANKDGSLYILSVAEKDSGSYVCVASNVVGSSENILQLVVQVPPKIIADQKRFEVIEGETVILPCKAHAVPVPEIKWQKINQINHNEDLDKFILNTGNLQIQAKFSDAGQYVCEAINPVGKASSIIELIVYILPKAEINGESPAIAVLGKEFSLTCEILGYPYPEIIWKKDGDLIFPTANVILKNNTLNVRSTEFSHKGQYTCEAKNIVGTASSTKYVDVYEPPKILKTDPKISAILGDELLIPCTATGYPEPVITWKKHGSFGFHQVKNEGLYFPYVQEQDAGKYSCTATNFAGKHGVTFQVFVYVPPIPVSEDVLREIEQIEGNRMELDCLVTAFPLPSVSWFKNEVEVSEEELRKSGVIIENDGQKLVFEHIRLDDAGTYVCKLINVAGETSETFNVDVLVPPVFRGPNLIKIRSEEGKAFELDCFAGGHPRPHIIWKKNRHVFSPHLMPGVQLMNDGSLLRIERSRKSDVGRYACIVMNKVGSSRREFEVSVLVPPAIQEERRLHMEVLSHEMAQLPCIVSGIPRPTIQWFLNGTSKLENQDNMLLIENGQKLNIFEVTENDAGLYTCVAHNDVGEVSKDIKLSVLVPPYTDHQDIIEEPKVKEGDEIVLNCKVAGQPIPQIIWTKDGHIVTSNTFPDVQLTDENKQLKILSAQKQDAGRYSCVASNKAGVIEKHFAVDILIPPQLGDATNFLTPLEEATAQEVSENWPVQLSCPFTGNPAPKMVWMKDNELIINSSNVMIIDNGKYLRITQTQVQDAGKYVCVASNDAGENKKEFDINVLVSPKIVGTETDNIRITEDESIILNCSAFGNPLPTVHWLKDGTELVLNDEKSTFISTDKTVIELSEAEPEDSGQYICIASNIVGSKEKKFTVDVLVPPTSKQETLGGLPEVSNVSVQVNRPVTFECTLTAYPPPEIKWLKNGEFVNPVQQSNLYIHSGGEKLTILRVRDSDSGRYSCIATNEVGESILDFALDVLVPPAIDAQEVKSTYYANEGDPIVIKCPVTGNPTPVITWLKDSDVILQELSPHVAFSEDFQHLYLKHALAKDAGKYTCIASNKVGTVENDFKLNVQIPPRLDDIQEARQSVSTILNKPTTLNCPVSGIPPPSVQWFKDGELMRPFADPNIVFSADGKQLKVFRTRVLDAATYTCEAVNVAGKTEKEFELNVQLPPKLLIRSNGVSDIFEGIEENSELTKVAENETVLLNCPVYGDPQPVIIWLKDGYLLSSNSEEYFWVTDDGQQLSIADIKASHAGHYVCVASNVAGTTERDFFVEVQVPPSLLSEPEEFEEVPLHRPVLMDCQVHSQSAPTYTWLKENNVIVFTEESLMKLLDDGSKLQLLKANPSHQGRFTCIVENEVGKVEKQFILDVRTPPVIQNSSIHHDVIENATVTFECLSSGNPEPEIVWLMNENVLPDIGINSSDIYFHHRKQILEIQRASANYSGQYKCIVSNSMGSTEKNFNLFVKVPPKIISSSADNITVVAHSSVELSCEAKGQPVPFVQWRKEENMINDASDPFIHVLNGGKTLQISRAREQDGGYYSCEFTNSVGKDSQSFFVEVLVPPKIEAAESKISLLTSLERNTTDFECYVQGNPKPQILWFKNGKPISVDDDERFKLLDDNQVLHISDLKVEDGDDYTCRATSELASAEKQFNLLVQAPPKILNDGSSDLIGELSEPLFISCPADGNPKPIISWMKNGQFIDPFSEPNLYILPKESNLLIRFASLEDSGTYTCIASNPVGQVEKHFTVNVHTPPRIDKSNYSSNQMVIYNNSIVLNCLASGIPHPITIWTKDNVAINTFAAYSNHQILNGGEQLIINSATEKDKGNYSCVVLNPVGKDEIQYEVNVLVPPKISPSMAKEEIKTKEGDNVVINCPLEESDHPKVITWLKDDEVLNSNTLPPHFGLSNDHKQMKIMRAQSSDAGRYTCKAANPAGSVEHETELNIIVPSKIVHPTEKITPVTVSERQSIFLECNVQGSPQPEIEWKKDNFSLVGFPKVSYPTSGKIRLTNVTLEESGNYSCIAFNEGGEDERIYVLQVNVPPLLNVSSSDLHQTVIQNSDLTLNCNAEGVPIPKVLWYKDSQMLMPGQGVYLSDDSMNLKITKVTVADAGKYSCMAVNDAGISEAEFFVKVHVPPMIEHIGVHGDQDLILNHSARLYCEALGLPSPNLTWFKDGNPIHFVTGVYSFSGGGRFLDIESVKVSDAGSYTCHAENQEGNVKKSMFLDVLVPPDITTGNVSISQQAVIGEPLRIECPAVGSPPPTITWLKNGFPIIENDHLQFLQNNYVLWFGSVLLSDAAEYMCIASNNAGSTEHGFNLTVLVPPTISDSQEMDSLSVIVGYPLVLKCVISGHPHPDIVWIKDGTILSAADDVNINEGILELKSAEVHHSGQYSCEASNVVGKSQKTYQVTVMVPPGIAENSGPELIASNIGEPVLMECHVTGNPNPSLMWFKGGLPLISNYRSNFQIRNQGMEFEILHPARSDSGTYKCVASSPAGNTSRQFFLSILEPPSIKDDVLSMDSVLGTEVVLDCEASGYPEPEILWLKEGSPVPKAGSNSSLVFKSVKLQDSGNYTCVATSEAGSTAHSTLLNVIAPPSISNSEIGIKVFTGESTLLPCDVTGLPLPQVMWHKDSKVIHNDSDFMILSNNSLVIRISEHTMAGIYTCVAENDAGIQEATRKLDVLSPPYIKDTFSEEYTTVQAQQIVLKCEADGIPIPTIVWEKNGVLLGKSDPRFKVLQLGRSGSLHISLVQPSDMGSYNCVAKNEAGVDTKAAKLVVWVPPTIDKSATTSLLTVKGRTLEIPCNTDGFPPPQVNWQLEGENIPPHSEVLPDGTLQINNIQAEDSGKYVCVAVNNAGRDSRSVKVDVNVPPAITFFPKSQDISVGETLSLACEAEGIPSPTITWLLNNTHVKGQTFSSVGRNELIIENAGKSNEGTYACLAQNEAGERKAVIAVRVRSPPIVLDFPGVQSAHLKDAVMLDCVVNGDPAPKIMWIKNGQRLQYNHRIQQAENGSLVIYNSLDEDSGQYKCIARNDFGSAESVAELIIRSPPNFVIHPQNGTADLGSSLSMDCKVEGEPKPLVIWNKDGEEFQENDQSFIFANNTLRIVAVQLSDEGVYTCHSSNELGTISAQAHLIVKVDGMWSQWQEWSLCSATCGNGLQQRHRYCDNPSPRNGGKNCMGPEVETQLCNALPCAVDGGWGNWMPWEDCSTTCGFGLRKHYRLCNNPEPQYGGENCTGDDTESIPCLLKECPVDGGWGLWLDWQPCSASCGSASQVRVRECNNPVPMHGGSQCVGEGKEEQDCSLPNCPVNGLWSSWSEWSFCSLSCGGGRQERRRECDSPAPEFGGRDCIGPYVEVNYCNNEPCPVNGEWSLWSSWGECSISCNKGQKKRFRTCTNPVPSGGGRHCTGSSQETEVCNAFLCPVDGKWADWSSWSSCSVTCGVGIRERIRSCTNPEPEYDGKDCVGESVQIEECGEQACDAVPLRAKGHLIGTVNGVDIGPSVVNTSISPFGMDSTVTSYIDNIPPNVVPLLKLLIPLLAPIYWTVAYEIGGAANGYTLTKGVFSRDTQIDFGTGEVLYMNHVARGLDKRGNLLVDTVITGEVPNISSGKVIVIHPYTENYVQLGPGIIYVFATKTYNIDELMLPYFWNHTISYKDIRRRMPFLVQRLHVNGIQSSYDSENEELNFIATSSISKGVHENTCPEGFNIDASGTYCNDIDECHTSQPCSHICINSPGSYSCFCPLGFVLDMDGNSCYDVDECDMNIGNCNASQECVNTIGSYQCLITCNEGFERTEDNMYCKDINECIGSQKVCAQQCINTVGSYSCSCSPGYVLVGKSACLDINECNLPSPPCSHSCVNTYGSYICLCPQGYGLLDERNCEDINECETGDFYCPKNHICENIDGSYDCIKPCAEGMSYAPNGTCVDIDECSNGLSACHFSQICANTHGSYQCSCLQGFYSDGPGKACNDINECLRTPSPCTYECLNLNGDYECLCAPGHKRLPDRKTCAGIEYLEDPSRNFSQRYRQNGYFQTTQNEQINNFNCPVGFVRQQGICRDIDECKIQGTCQHYCVNTRGSFRCVCPTGYRLSSSKKSCEDIDECSEQNINCGPDKMCFNMKGSFECIDTPCPPNYERNSRTGYCELTCEKANIACPPGVKYADILAFKMVALPSGIRAYQDLVRLIAYDQDGIHLPNTVFSVIENDTGIPFRISLTDGKGVLYSQKAMDSNREYKIKVKAISYDRDNQTILYTTKFLVFLSVSKYPY